MRLWSLHPKYLDAKGLVAVWREGLLAREVLRGETKGYRHHPQLDRFKAASDPLAAIDAYLGVVCDEAERRGYAFDRSKIGLVGEVEPIAVTEGQIAYEWNHLMGKLNTRDPDRYRDSARINQPEIHPVFVVVEGGIEGWEKPAMLKG